MSKTHDIFINYRLNGGYETARHIYDLLKRDGYSVSFDQDNLMNGNFDKALLDRIAKCKDFILICDADVFRRAIEEQGDNEHDWWRNRSMPPTWNDPIHLSYSMTHHTQRVSVLIKKRS